MDNPASALLPSPTYSHFVKSQEHLLHETKKNPHPTRVPPPTAGLAGAFGERHVISFIGLPMHGKPFMAYRLLRYLSFFHGAKCKMFDLAQPENANDDDVLSRISAFMEEEDHEASAQVALALDGIDIDDPSHEENMRRGIDSGRIAIIYSLNTIETGHRTWSGSSKERRWQMQEYVDSFKVHTRLMFIEVIVTELDLIHRFIRHHFEQTVPEAELERVTSETEARIEKYKRKYVTIQDDGTEDDLSYMKLINYGKGTVTNGVHGYLMMRIVQLLSHIHPRRHTIYLSRHGQSAYNVVHKIGGNPGLSPNGEKYAQWLGQWVPENICGSTDPAKQRPCRLWTSSMKRTIDTARYLPHPTLELAGRKPKHWNQMSLRVYRNLDEIFAGEYEGMTYEEIEKYSGDEAILRKKDKLGYRYPRGESYFDLIARLDALMHELESYHEPLLIISHQATLRMVYAYLMGFDRRNAPKLEISLHTVIKITYDGYTDTGRQQEERFHFKPEDEGGYNAADIANDGQKNL